MACLKNTDSWAPPFRDSDSVDQENIQESAFAAVVFKISRRK